MVRRTDHPDMTIAVDYDFKHKTKPKQQLLLNHSQVQIQSYFTAKFSHNDLYQIYTNLAASLNKMATRAKIEISLKDISSLTTGPN